MFNFVADPKDGTRGNVACQTCCCVPIHMPPGESNLLRINYSPWTIPIGGYGLTVNTWLDISKITPFQAEDLGNGAPIAGALIWDSATLTPIVGNLNDYMIDPEGDAMLFDVLPLYGPTNGTLDLNRITGVFTYTPNPGAGQYAEHIYFKATDTAGNVTIAQMTLGYLGASTAHIPKINVPLKGRKVDPTYNTLTLPIAAGADTVPGEVYRINIRQEAIDCDGNKFYHTSCYDIVISKC